MLALIAIATFLSTTLGGVFALSLKDRLHLVLGFSAGAVIGVAFFDLLPESIHLAGATDPTFITAIVALGFVLYLILDRAVILHRHDDAHEHAHSARGLWGAGTLSLHSFLDGLAVGFAFHVSPQVGLIVALAVLAHDFSDGINTVSMIMKNGGTRTQAMNWLFADALAPVCGIIVSHFVTVTESQLGFILALFTGFFFYIGTSDLLPESHHAHPVKWTTISTVLGIAFMYLIVSIAHM